MRLTLRTLLAYMDDILEPQDHEELEKRIESSDFATDLIHRTRDTMRRLRLSAPPISGEGMGLDPNTVAEYLDNTLVPDQVPDFERVCLQSESDIYLSEVACCHHVLTMVLGEPAEIDPELRKRMYSLPAQGPKARAARVEPKQAASPLTTVVHTATLDMNTVAAPAPVRRVEVPDYLRAAETPLWKRLLPAIAAVLLLSTVSYFAFREGGWLRNNAQLARNDDQSVKPPVTDTIPSEDAVPFVVDSDNAEESPVPNEGATDATPPIAETAPVERASPVVPPMTETGEETLALPSGEAVSEEVTTVPPTIPAAPNGGETTTPSSPMEPMEVDLLPPQNIDDATVNPQPPAAATAEGLAELAATANGTGEKPAPTAPTVPLPPQGEMPAEGPAVPEGTTAPEGTVPPAEGVAADVVLEDAEPAAPPTLGTFSSTRQMLLKHEPDGSWRRLPPRAPVVAGSELLSLPTYRPIVALASGLNMELVGGTLVQVEAVDATAALPAPRLKIVYGQALLINTSMAELTVPLQIGEVAATARIKPNATLAIEAHRIFQAGVDAEKVPAPVLAVLFAPSGGVVWESPGAKYDVTNPSMWSLAGDSVGPLDAYAATPWIDGAPLNFWEQMSSPAVERVITSDKPVDVQLLGLYENTRKKEEKALITECSMHVGQFVPAVQSLQDPNQAPQWEKQIEALRMAMSRSPELAKRVKDTLIEQQGADKAPDLYQLLCGYTPEQVGTTPDQVQTGALKQLIDWLESDQLIYRVLAFDNLKHITGKQLTYNPAGNNESRSRAVKVWRLRLKDNELMPPLPQ